MNALDRRHICSATVRTGSCFALNPCGPDSQWLKETSDSVLGDHYSLYNSLQKRRTKGPLKMMSHVCSSGS